TPQCRSRRARSRGVLLSRLSTAAHPGRRARALDARVLVPSRPLVRASRTLVREPLAQHPGGCLPRLSALARRDGRTARSRGLHPDPVGSDLDLGDRGVRAPAMKVVIPGGSGQVGTILARALAARGHEVVVLTRRSVVLPWRVVLWDAVSPGGWEVE